MPNSVSLMAYTDVKEVLDKAIESKKGLKVSFDTVNGAIRWTSRANSFRILDRKNNLKLYQEGHSMHGCSPYDTLWIKRTEKEVEIKPRSNDELTIMEL